MDGSGSDSRTVAVVSVPASPWYGSPSMAADAAWGLRVCLPWLDGVAWMLPAHSGEGWKADGSPSLTAVPWPW